MHEPPGSSPCGSRRLGGLRRLLRCAAWDTLETGEGGADVSWQPCEAPELRAGPCDPVEAMLVPRERDLGGFSVRRVLPSQKRRAIGPFVFLDQALVQQHLRNVLAYLDAPTLGQLGPLSK